MTLVTAPHPNAIVGSIMTSILNPKEFFFPQVYIQEKKKEEKCKYLKLKVYSYYD